MGPNVLKKAQMSDKPKIKSVYYQGKKKVESICMNISIYSIIVYATVVPIKMPRKQAAKTRISAS